MRQPKQISKRIVDLAMIVLLPLLMRSWESRCLFITQVTAACRAILLRGWEKEMK